MLITIKVPENTSRLWFSVVEDGYENESKPVTMGMIIAVKHEEPETCEEAIEYLDGGVEKRPVNA